MNVRKYFWDLNEKAIAETEKILKDTAHPKYVQRMFTLLSRLDDSKQLFSVMNQEQFINNWTRIRRYWNKMGQAKDFMAWWDIIYKNLLEKKGIKQKFQGRPSKVLQMIGEIIKRARIEKGLNQLQLAQQTGMKQPHISSLEKGEKNVTLETLVRICRILNIKNLPIC